MGWKDTARKAERKVFGKGGAKRRYGIGKGKGGLKLMTLAKDLEMIKNRLNVEKKHKELDVNTFTLGQVNGNTNDSAAIDITPIISEGTGHDERVGQSLKLTGMSFPVSFTQQTYCMGDRKVRMTLLRVRASDNGVSGAEALEQVWEVNRLVGNSIRDYNAPRRYRNSKTDGISVLRSKSFYVKGPTLDGADAAIADRERNVLTTRFSVALKDILRFDDGVSATLPNGIKYYLVFQADAGKSSSTTDSTLDVPVTNALTGLTVRLGQRNWWVDN